MHDLLCQIENAAVLPAIVLDDASHATPLAEALLAGGLPCAEVTLRTPDALDGLARMAAHSANLIVGAGTVLEPWTVLVGTF